MTIIDERHEYFENHLNNYIDYGYLDRNTCAGKIKDTMRDAYCVDVSPYWVEGQLLENRHAEIYVRIIKQCGQMLASTTCDKLLAKQLKNIRSRYRAKLLAELGRVVRKYCL